MMADLDDDTDQWLACDDSDEETGEEYLSRSFAQIGQIASE